MENACKSCGKKGLKIGTFRSYFLSDFVENKETEVSHRLEMGAELYKTIHGKIGFTLRKGDVQDVFLCPVCRRKIARKYLGKKLLWLLLALVAAGVCVGAYLNVYSVGILVKIIVTVFSVVIVFKALFKIGTKIDKDVFLAGVILGKAGGKRYAMVESLSYCLKGLHESFSNEEAPKKDEYFSYFERVNGTQPLYSPMDRFRFRDFEKLPQFLKIDGVKNRESLEFDDHVCRIDNVSYLYKVETE
jgi:hypothetical protein